MWKVVVTEIQDAGGREPFDVPAGAFFVSKERFCRTVQNLDLSSLVNAIEAMQSAGEYGREMRRVSSQGIPPQRSSVRGNAAREMHRLTGKRTPPKVVATQFLSKTDS